MQDLTHRSSLSRGLASMVVVAILTIQSGASNGEAQDNSSSGTPLSRLREAARVNEGKATLLRMEFKFHDKASGDDPKVLKFPSSEGGEPLHVKYLYAQDGKRLHATHMGYTGTRCTASWVNVVDGEILKGAELPDRMVGWIHPPEAFAWGAIPPMRFSFRPLNDQRLLSEYLVDKHASVQSEHVTVSGRDAAIVKVMRPDAANCFHLLWIDWMRGIPLRQEFYVPDESGREHKCVEVHEIRKFHQLPNGGWIAVEGDIKQHMVNKGLVFDYVQHCVVDVNSISIDKKDIPDSLFDIQFPPGAIIQNHIVK